MHRCAPQERVDFAGLQVAFSTDHLPKRRLSVTATIVERYAGSSNNEISMLKNEVERAIARACAKDNDLVKIGAANGYVQLSADCIVMTTDEFAKVMRDQFDAGMQHARRFGSVSWVG